MKVIRYYNRRPGYYAAEYYEDEMAKPTPGANATPDDDTSFKQYEILVDLYKHWLELILKYNTAFYAITGAMVSFYLSRPEQYLRFSLLLPLAIGIGLVAYAIQCVFLMRRVEEEFDRLKDKLKLGITPEAVYVKRLLIGSGIFFGMVVVGLSLLVFDPFHISGKK